MQRLRADIRQSLLTAEINRGKKRALSIFLTLMFPLNTGESWRSSHHIILLCLYTFSAHVGKINEADLI